MSSWQVITGDCRDVMAIMLDDNSVDSVVCDPPYELNFLGKSWDRSGIAYDALVWSEALRVLKPGGHLIAFGSSRKYHRLAAAIEDAGFQIRDQIQWLYGTGFPKSMDVSKAIDKMRYAPSEVLEVTAWIKSARDAAGLTNRAIDDAFGFSGMAGHWTSDASQPAVPTLEQVPQLLEVVGVPLADVPERIRTLIWTLNGKKGQPGAAWLEREVVASGQAGLSSSHCGEQHAYGYSESYDITAPATEAAKQWSGWGTALKPAHEPAVLARKPLIGTIAANVLEHGAGALNIDGCRVGGEGGRWPANVCHDDSAEVRAAFPRDDTGHTARFFYSAKAQTGEREAGLDGLPMYSGGELTGREDGAPGTQSGRAGAGRQSEGRRNMHPTVKPIALMRWCLRLVTPPGGLVLDPFTGSGSTGCAAALEGMRFVGAELDAQHAEIARLRIAYWACEQSPITADQADGAPVQSAMPWGREEVER